MKIIALGLLLGAAVVAASAHVSLIPLSQNPVPTCSPDNPKCDQPPQVKK